MAAATPAAVRAWFDADGWRLEADLLRVELQKRGVADDDDLMVDLIDEGADRRRRQPAVPEAKPAPLPAKRQDTNVVPITDAPSSGNVPPQSLEAEESVLGAMMISPGAISSCSEILVASDFYRESHAKIYRAAVALDERSEPVDAITLTNELEQRGELEAIGGRVRVHELAALVPASANAPHYANIVKETATLRGLIRAGGEIQRLGWDRPGETPELVDQAESIIFDLSQGRSGDDQTEHVDVALKDTFRRITDRYESGLDTVGLASGFHALDDITLGFEPGNLILIAARPSIGKSALLHAILANVAIRQGLPVCLFTAEMSKSEVVQRLISREARVDGKRIRRGNLNPDDWPRITHAAERISRAPFYHDDSATLGLGYIRRVGRRMKQRHPDLALLAVDYIQLLDGDGENQNLKISSISRGLKMLARELNVPILALSQLNRAVEQRNDKRPVLSDLRDSGSLEQDADLVMFLYRDDYYHPESDQQGTAEVNLAKHRNGPTDMVRLAFQKNYASFSDLAHQEGLG